MMIEKRNDREDKRIWILPPGRRGAMEAGLAESAAMLLRFSTEDFRLLQNARSRTKRKQSLCSKSVEATQSAVAKAVAVARDVKAEQGRREYFFSATRNAETIRNQRSRSPSPSPAHTKSSQEKSTPTEQKYRARRSSVPSVRGEREGRKDEQTTPQRPPWGRPSRTPTRSRSPSPASQRSPLRSPVSRNTTSLIPQRPSSVRSNSPATARGRDISTQKSIRGGTLRTRSSSPASIRREKNNNNANSTPTSTMKKRRQRNHQEDILAESPEDLRRQIEALTLDLERLKQRHRRALERAEQDPAIVHNQIPAVATGTDDGSNIIVSRKDEESEATIAITTNGGKNSIE